jgi:hypothetical protein
VRPAPLDRWAVRHLGLVVTTTETTAVRVVLVETVPLLGLVAMTATGLGRGLFRLRER